MDSIRQNLARLEERILAAARRSGRSREDIQLVAVSKHVPWSRVREAAAAGQAILGENYIQEAGKKIALARQSEEGRNMVWHFIGHLQSNKAGLAVDLFEVIESVDRLKVALALERYAEERHKRQKVLVQVNIGREPRKSGVPPEECEPLLQAMQRQCPRLKVLGLMAMPPLAADPESSRPYFRALREMAAGLGARGLIGDQGQPALSMGMSADFEVAIEEGATLVRVGTALFGPRP